LTKKQCSWERLDEKVRILKARKKNWKQDGDKTLPKASEQGGSDGRATREQPHRYHSLRQCFRSDGSVAFLLQPTDPP